MCRTSGISHVSYRVQLGRVRTVTVAGTLGAIGGNVPTGLLEIVIVTIAPAEIVTVGTAGLAETVMAGTMATVVIPTDAQDIVITTVTGSPWQRLLQAPL
jgi:hypothetical protein